MIAATVSEGLTALNNMDLSGLKKRIEELRAQAEAELKRKGEAESFMAALERAKKLGMS